jgi:acyl carrier protein phosphodiesterase
MNYLGHAFLSMGNSDWLAGNMIGDFVKGKAALENYPPEIAKGIMLHRHIDSFTDQHPAVLRAKVFFREVYDLYSGAVVDIVFDHFLANDPKHFQSEKELLDFTQKTYRQLEQAAAFFPEKFSRMFPFMKEQNWLYHYRTLQGIQKSLNGLQRRAPQMPDVAEAYKIFVGHYYQLTQCYYEFIDDMIRHVKVELSKT